jgi:gamma-glutamylcyclotransferase (GGCT)/AIG2-like uncharacterized protein YtfP
MPRLFSYGSLQQPAVQLATFGRLLAGCRDELPGFELQTVRHGDKQLANVIHSARADSRVAGTVFEVSDAELAAADAYERGDDYTRIQVTMASGTDAWVYTDSGLHSRSHGDRR